MQQDRILRRTQPLALPSPDASAASNGGGSGSSGGASSAAAAAAGGAGAATAPPTASDDGKDWQARMDRIHSLSDDALLLNTTGIDWESIAINHVRTRTATDCMIQWMGNDDPRINTTPWTVAEDKTIMKLAEKYRGHEWVKVATELDTNRTVMQCFARWQRSLNPKFIRSAWKKEEDDKLRAQVVKYGEKNWGAVAAKMKCRTDQQCLNRWYKSAKPGIKSGRWSPEEDLALKLAVRAFGAQRWHDVARFVPGRTDVKSVAAAAQAPL